MFRVCLGNESGEMAPHCGPAGDVGDSGGHGVGAFTVHTLGSAKSASLS